MVTILSSTLPLKIFTQQIRFRVNLFIFFKSYYQSFPLLNHIITVILLFQLIENVIYKLVRFSVLLLFSPRDITGVSDYARKIRDAAQVGAVQVWLLDLTISGAIRVVLKLLLLLLLFSCYSKTITPFRYVLCAYLVIFLPTVIRA